MAFALFVAIAAIGLSIILMLINRTQKRTAIDRMRNLPWLDGAAPGAQAKAAKILGISETAVKAAIHRLRIRFRELIRAQISATLSDRSEAAAELQHLIAVASAPGLVRN